MSFTEEVINYSKHIESLLFDLGGVGRGLREKADSIKPKLSDLLWNRLCFIATIRNKTLHEHGFKFQGDEKSFLSSCDTAVSQLLALVKAQTQPSQPPPQQLAQVVHLPSQAPQPVPSSPEPLPLRPGLRPPSKLASPKPNTVKGVPLTITCLVACLLILPFTCTQTKTVVVKPGIFWDDTEKREVTDWVPVVFVTFICCGLVLWYTNSKD